jgi:hypothetical protein
MHPVPRFKHRHAIAPILLTLALVAGCSNPLASDLGDGQFAEGEAREFVGAITESLGPAEDRATANTSTYACAEGGTTNLIRVGARTIDRDGEETFDAVHRGCVARGYAFRRWTFTGDPSIRLKTSRSNTAVAMGTPVRSVTSLKGAVQFSGNGTSGRCEMDVVIDTEVQLLQTGEVRATSRLTGTLCGTVVNEPFA